MLLKAAAGGKTPPVPGIFEFSFRIVVADNSKATLKIICQLKLKRENNRQNSPSGAVSRIVANNSRCHFLVHRQIKDVVCVVVLFIPALTEECDLEVDVLVCGFFGSFMRCVAAAEEFRMVQKQFASEAEFCQNSEDDAHEGNTEDAEERVEGHVSSHLDGTDLVDVEEVPLASHHNRTIRTRERQRPAVTHNL